MNRTNHPGVRGSVRGAARFAAIADILLPRPPVLFERRRFDPFWVSFLRSFCRKTPNKSPKASSARSSICPFSSFSFPLGLRLSSRLGRLPGGPWRDREITGFPCPRPPPGPRLLSPRLLRPRLLCRSVPRARASVVRSPRPVGQRNHQHHQQHDGAAQHRKVDEQSAGPA